MTCEVHKNLKFIEFYQNQLETRKWTNSGTFMLIESSESWAKRE